MRNFEYLYLVFLFLVTSCFPLNQKELIQKNNTNTYKAYNKTNSPNNNDAGVSNNKVSSSNNNKGLVEITQVVDPQMGIFKKKISISKNYQGYIYLAGLNITSLRSKVVQVKFHFGRERSTITLPAVIGRISEDLPIPNNIDVIQVDATNFPFHKLRLLYDLFDYNDYDEDSSSSLSPTNDPYNTNLYCRGLFLQDDPTFKSSDVNTACDSTGEICNYAYAKIGDSTLYNIQIDSNGNSILASQTPKIEQRDLLNLKYINDSGTENMLKCLPDSILSTDLNSVLGTNFSSPLIYGSSGIFNSITGDYMWIGPYKLYATTDWQISGGAIYSNINASNVTASGIFSFTLPGSPISNLGYKSFLFPRETKINYSRSGLEYFGSNQPFGTKTLQTISSAGESKWMDGCNMRVKSFDQYSHESISSCNVTATIEVIAKTNNKEEVLASTKDVKIQLIKSGLDATSGKLFSAMRNCTDNGNCGPGECCFSNRCWSQDLVGQCTNSTSTKGNLGTGEKCTSDFDCSSLCCNSTTGTCKIHISNETDNLCSKVAGQSCVSEEFCKLEYITQCFIIKKNDTNGSLSCELRCYSVPTFGNCVNGICHVPRTPIRPSFDLNAPDRCEDAIDEDDIPIDITL